MSSIVIASLFILFLALIILVLVSLNNRHRRKLAGDLVGHFNELSERDNLSFTRKEIMENFVVGLDESCKKLFVVRRTGDRYDSQIIDLKEIRKCSMKKLYKSINMGTVKKKRYESRFDKIVLEFNYFDNRNPIEIPFYESGVDHLSDKADLEQKAGSWAASLTQMLNMNLKNTA